mmetsp:Transcript_96308/g.272288  ORF Transcript_96308/g.272288 Transcript_96308/m.272288 type:complete len:843 (+) Transcript_96308:167-2695(+)|eukprot:CAMPEP_0117493398 /NCGR_PEP_ID=MMETSP0784-20121206/19077_1 /TAXON_ID=39447 /ORGANISM="" /LENGTH=842 /DNA_ID=CAMNT_0005288249 /DNA_START=112 /DNA_END=2640 /DNA_ORIENTATION=-
MAYAMQHQVGGKMLQRASAPVSAPPAVDASQAILWRPSPGGAAGHSMPNLYWAPHSRCPVGEGVIAYSTDDKPEFAYEPFNEGRDFGPLDIARTVMYCHWVDALCSAHAGCTALVHLTSDHDEQTRANSVVLCCAYLLLAHGASADIAFRPFQDEPVVPFLDCRGEHVSGSAISDEADVEFELGVIDVLRGIERARDLGWLNYRTFSVEDHASMLRPEHGDMSWLLPGKALALASPWAEPRDQDGLPVCTPAQLSAYFLPNGVRLIVQCNDPEREEEGDRRRLLSYTGRSFEEVGVRHVHLPFEDGGCPSIAIVLMFLETVKTNVGSFAVHCRSGLGRTATLIGIYAIQNLGFTARSFIGWARVMRPGTVHGSQQQYLVNLEPHIKLGSSWPLSSLTHREGLTLLPRRELRFWALDCGIPASRTRSLTHADIVELILEAHGLQDNPQPTYGLQGHKQTTPESFVLSTPPAYGGYATQPAPYTQTSQLYAEDSYRNETEVAPYTHQAIVLAAAPLGCATQPSGLTGLSAAIASLSHGLGGKAAATAASFGDGESVAKVDEWEDVLRYVNLLAAVQEDGAPSWDRVRRCIEDLREQCQGKARAGVSAGVNSPTKAEIAALQQVHEARKAAAHEAETREAELNECLQEAKELHRECELLRTRVAAEREERASERRRVEDRSEALARDLKSDEARLEGAVREVEELRGKVLRQGGLEPWQVERVEQLRSEIAVAKEESSRYGQRCQEQRARLNAAQRQQQQQQLFHYGSGRAGEQTIGTSGTDGATGLTRSFAEPNALETSVPVGDGAFPRLDDELPWENARRSIEQLRDRFQSAVQQARMTIAAS